MMKARKLIAILLALLMLAGLILTAVPAVRGEEPRAAGFSTAARPGDPVSGSAAA